MIDIQCPETVDNFFDFTCNFTMLLPPRIGFKSHNVTVTVGTLTPKNFNSTFNTSNTQVTTNIITPGIYNISVYERNYNVSYTARITVNQSKILNLKNVCPFLKRHF